MVKYIYHEQTRTFRKLPSYIYQRNNGMFEIRKRIGGTLLYWGSFSTLEEAKLYRAYYIGKNWLVNPSFRNNKDKYIFPQGNGFVIVKVTNGQRDYFGFFHDIQSARVERDICVACEWDFDRIVEFDERELVEV